MVSLMVKYSIGDDLGNTFFLIKTYIVKCCTAVEIQEKYPQLCLLVLFICRYLCSRCWSNKLILDIRTNVGHQIN